MCLMLILYLTFKDKFIKLYKDYFERLYIYFVMQKVLSL